MNHFVTTKTYNIFIDIAARNGHFQDAKNVFEKAKASNMTDLFSYMNFIKAAKENDDLEAATQAINEANAKWPWESFTE